MYNHTIAKLELHSLASDNFSGNGYPKIYKISNSLIVRNRSLKWMFDKIRPSTEPWEMNLPRFVN